MRVVGLGGGIGASRLWRILAPRVDLTVIANTGEDLWHFGLRVCPDLDTTLYALSDRQDLERGWGLTKESFRVMDEVRALGHDVWFNLGDRDLATHLLRTSMLREGVGLTQVTATLANAMGVNVTVLPMTEQEVTTTVVTTEGDLHYEEYLVKYACTPTPWDVRYDGANDAAPAPGVIDALLAADLIVLAPSNPIASIGPILAVPGLRDVLISRRDVVVAVSPTVHGVEITDAGELKRANSRHTLLRMRGIDPTPAGIAAHYSDLCHFFAVDPADETFVTGIAEAGPTPVVAPLLWHLGAPQAPLLTAFQRLADVNGQLAHS